MGALSGFKLLLQTPLDDAKAKQDAVPIAGDFSSVAGIQAKSVSINAQEIDITSGSTDEWRTLLADRGTRSWDISGNGVMDDGALAKKLESRSIDNSLNWFRVIRSDQANRAYTGKFKISTFNFEGNHDGSVNFDISLMSSGPLTITG